MKAPRDEPPTKMRRSSTESQAMSRLMSRWRNWLSSGPGPSAARWFQVSLVPLGVTTIAPSGSVNGQNFGAFAEPLPPSPCSQISTGRPAAGAGVAGTRQ